MKAFAISLLVAAVSSSAADLDKLKVLYVRESPQLRVQHFEGFLRENVAEVKAIHRDAFKQADAEGFDVVLLDWSQSEAARDERKTGRSPLGDRATWSKPTVLLGSAGLNLAAAWKVRGGSG